MNWASTTKSCALNLITNQTTSLIGLGCPGPPSFGDNPGTMNSASTTKSRALNLITNQTTSLLVLRSGIHALRAPAITRVR